MENFRKLAKIAALDQKIPGPVCGNQDCEDLCAEAYDAALSLRLDPVEILRKTIQRELLCIPAEDRSGHACRFGFLPVSDSLALSGKMRKARKRKDEEEIIHIFRTGVNECKKCQALEGTKISSDVWADEEKMKTKGFWKQKNGKYLPHPNCKCHWEEKLEQSYKTRDTVKTRDIAKDTSQRKSDTPKSKISILGALGEKREAARGRNAAEKSEKSQFNMTRDSSFTGKEVEFYVKGGPKKFENALGIGHEVDGFETLLERLEDNYPDHSIGNLRIIGHGGFASTPIGGDSDTFQALIGSIIPRHKRIISRLKRMLSSHSIIEFRMCSVGVKGEKADENGPEFAQKLANLLGCRVKVYLEPVSPYGLRPTMDKEGKKFIPENFAQWAEYEIYAPQP